jgi:hypothetical protein
MIGKITYEPHYCAYVDILGFRELISGLRQGSTNFEMLRGLLETLQTPEKGTTKEWHTEFRAQSISDAVAISTLVNFAGLVEVLHALESLAMKLLKQGYFVRGALVKGSLYHDERMVFGTALVRAYELETQTVRYPRIMVTRDVVDDMKENEKRWDALFKERIRQASDGPMYVHTLRQVEADAAKAHLSNVNGVIGSGHVLADLDEYRQRIQKRFDESMDNPRHFEKIQWFARYWNRSVPFGTLGNKSVTGPGLDEMAWFREASVPPPESAP